MPDANDFHDPGGHPGQGDDWDPNRTQRIDPPDRTIGWGTPVSALRSSGTVVAAGFLAGAVIAGSMLFGAFFMSPAAKAPAPLPQTVARALPVPDPAEIEVRTLPSPPRPEPPAVRTDVTRPPTDGSTPAVHPVPNAAVSGAPEEIPGDNTRPAPVRWPSQPLSGASVAATVPPADPSTPIVMPPAPRSAPKTSTPAADTTAGGRNRISAEGYEVFVPQGGPRSPEPASPPVESSTPAPVVSTPPSNPDDSAEPLPDPARLRTQAERDAAWELRRRRVRERYQDRQRGKAVP